MSPIRANGPSGPPWATAHAHDARGADPYCRIQQVARGAEAGYLDASEQQGIRVEAREVPRRWILL